VLALVALAVAAVVALSATLSAVTGGGLVAAIAGLVLLVVPRALALAVAVPALALAVGVAIDAGASQSAAPLWGAGLLVAGALAERSLSLPAHGSVEVDALVGWLAGLAVLAGAGLAAGALVLLAATTDAGSAAVGLIAAALLAVVPAVLARRRGAG
jgi:hypothetical protein